MATERFNRDATFVQTFIDRAPGVDELALPPEIDSRWKKLNNLFLGLTLLATHRLFEKKEWKETLEAASEEMGNVYAWFKPLKVSAETMQDGPEKNAIKNFDDEFKMRVIVIQKMGAPLRFHL